MKARTNLKVWWYSIQKLSCNIWNIWYSFCVKFDGCVCIVLPFLVLRILKAGSLQCLLFWVKLLILVRAYIFHMKIRKLISIFIISVSSSRSHFVTLGLRDFSFFVAYSFINQFFYEFYTKENGNAPFSLGT